MVQGTYIGELCFPVGHSSFGDVDALAILLREENRGRHVEVWENAGVVRLGREFGELAADFATPAWPPGVFRAVAIARLHAGWRLSVTELLARHAAGEPVCQPHAPQALQAAVDGVVAVRRAHAQTWVAQGAAAAELRRGRQPQEGPPAVRTGDHSGRRERH